MVLTHLYVEGRTVPYRTPLRSPFTSEVDARRSGATALTAAISPFGSFADPKGYPSGRGRRMYRAVHTAPNRSAGRRPARHKRRRGAQPHQTRDFTRREGSRSGVRLLAGTAQSDKPRDESELVAVLREQLTAERPAHSEARRLLAAALERIPPQLEAPSEQRGSPESGGEQEQDRAASLP